MVGDKIIYDGLYDQVVFSVTGWGGTTIAQLSSGDYYDYFIGSYCRLVDIFGKVDGILYHQGESDSWNKNYDYYNDFEEFHDKMKDDGITAPFYLSLASFCNSSIDSTLLEIQDNIIIDFENVYRGPNTDLLTDPEFRLNDNCHFSLAGLDFFSDMWLESISKQSEE